MLANGWMRVTRGTPLIVKGVAVGASGVRDSQDVGVCVAAGVLLGVAGTDAVPEVEGVGVAVPVRGALRGAVPGGWVAQPLSISPRQRLAAAVRFNTSGSVQGQPVRPAG